MLLAISSLHLAQQRPEQKTHYMTLAIEHQTTALPAYRHAIKNLTSETDEQISRAMMSYAGLTAVYALLSPPISHSSDVKGTSSISQLAESFVLLRGASEIRGIVGDYKEACTIPPPQTTAPYSDNNGSYYPEDSHLVAVETMIWKAAAKNSEPEPVACANLHALSLLRQCFALLYDPICSISIKHAITFWIGAVPTAYLKAVKELQVGALIVLAHWCVMLNEGKTLWYLRDSGPRILAGICEVLGDEWKVELAWPLAHSNGETVYNGF